MRCLSLASDILSCVDQEGDNKNTLAPRKQNSRPCKIIRTQRKTLSLLRISGFPSVASERAICALRNPDAARVENPCCGDQEGGMTEKQWSLASVERSRCHPLVFQPHCHYQGTAEVAAQVPFKFSSQGGCHDVIMSSTPTRCVLDTCQVTMSSVWGMHEGKGSPGNVLPCSDFSNMPFPKCRKTFPAWKKSHYYPYKAPTSAIRSGEE